MADLGLVEAEFGGTEPRLKQSLVSAFRYVLGNLSFGAVEHQTRAKNFQAYWLTGTTSSNANEEFSIVHGLSRAPSFVFPALPLDQIGSQMVPLTVSRAADTQRVYLKSSSTSAVIAVLAG